MIGISIKPTIGVGDAVQFSSVPENYFRKTGEMLLDVSQPWFFDFNPYVVRDKSANPKRVVEMWSYGSNMPMPRDTCFTSMAERHAMVFGVNHPVLNRPRLYRFEKYPYEKREMVLLHTHGVSHGTMPEHVLEHVLKKYKQAPLFHIGKETDPDIGIPKLKTETLWDLAETISKARMFIGMDSGPSWIASCYPDVIVKKLRIKPSHDELKDWIPLYGRNIHSYWDDRIAQIHNTSEDDIGFTASYRRM